MVSELCLMKVGTAASWISGKKQKRFYAYISTGRLGALSIAAIDVKTSEK